MLTWLSQVPQTPGDWAIWSFSHKTDHDEIREKIQASGGPNLVQYQLDPIPTVDFPNWLRRNQQSHIDFTEALGQQNSDLSSLDPTNRAQLAAWIYSHYQEHLSAHPTLGV